ncbi:DUF4230 domain-containing protein [Nodosilinea sp. LEGE 07298]|uniref:DUF4230 domain-containing protein n=1 Tax=Nodosilinea sp. LEGE 07298 TaxID=2777970 RepID=UPI00187FA233|nr:DUF4230 domain-containing protein [Nodosilinea sp. LEGE 07298]MBE9111470.1 DUF4230 domain-containing protein [Nodosilinea sp. LEGE 07298]
MKFLFNLICFGATVGAAIAFFSPLSMEHAVQQQVEGVKASAVSNSSGTSTKVQTIDLRQVAFESLQHVAELHTVESQFNLQIPVELERQLAGVKVGSTTLNYSATGRVKAGVDLGAITQEDIQIVNGIVTLQMPQAEFFEIYVNVEDAAITETSFGFGPSQTASALVEAQKEAHTQIGELACDSDILSQASEQAAQVLKAYVSEVIVEPADECSPVVGVQESDTVTAPEAEVTEAVPDEVSELPPSYIGGRTPEQIAESQRTFGQ